MKDKKTNKDFHEGITLVALVITVVILLILAGISISQLTGNGLFESAKQAREKSKNAKEKEDMILSEYEKYMSNDMHLNQETDNSVRYVILEVEGYYEGYGAAINELAFYDEYKEKLNYSVLYNLVYDSVTNGIPSYWTNINYWNYTNLNDGETSYTSNSQGGQNATLFIHPKSTDNSNLWSRFVIDFGKEVKIGQIRVCIGGVDGRTPKKITTYRVNNFVDGKDENSTYYKNIKNKDDENITKISQINIDKNLVSATWIDFFSKDNNLSETRYAIVEVEGHYEGNGTAINELAFYDEYKEKLNYSVLYNLVYDSLTNGIPYYWTNTNYWNYTNLNDGETSYTSNSQGGQNSTLFIYGNNTDNSNLWSRFIIDFGTNVNIEQIKAWIGGVDGRTPKHINIYNINNFIDGTEEGSTYITNVKNKSEKGLTKITEKDIDKSFSVSTEVDLIN